MSGRAVKPSKEELGRDHRACMIHIHDDFYGYRRPIHCGRRAPGASGATRLAAPEGRPTARVRSSPPRHAVPSRPRSLAIPHGGTHCGEVSLALQFASGRSHGSNALHLRGFVTKSRAACGLGRLVRNLRGQGHKTVSGSTRCPFT